MDQSKDAKQIQDLAQQLAAQFTAMRPTLRSPGASSSAATHAPAAASDASITQLAAQLGQLLGQSASTEPQQQQQQGEVTTPTADPFASVPDPSIYEKEFTDVYLNVNASVLRFEDRELFDLASDQMPIDKFFEEAEGMTKEYPDDSIDDIVVRQKLLPLEL
ncbi:hypothetical protein BGZ72_008181 [Mortierella alpina]|nr:hypothetical protein BGZ72_008181 [Mortierella alpina]